MSLITVDQLFIILGAVVVVILALILVKKVILKLLTAVIICMVASYCFLGKMPDHINLSNITSVASQYAPSDFVKFDSSSVQVKLGKSWVDVKDIQSVVKDKDGVMKVMVKGQGIEVKDANVQSVINALIQN
jgi:hypothetical protein